MTTFNGERFVAEELDSIAAQTLLPSELLVGDDASEDGTLEIVERFAARAPFPVIVHRNPRRLGSVENMVTTSLRTRGPIVALADWDDVWHPTKLERVARWFDDPSVALVVHRTEVVDESLERLGRVYPAIRRTSTHEVRRVDPWLALPGMAMTFRKAILEAVPSNPQIRPREAGGNPMDFDDWISHLAGALGKTVLLAEDLCLYRQHGASYMGARGGDGREQVARGLRLSGQSFAQQAVMFQARAGFWEHVALDAATADWVRREAAEAAGWCRKLAFLQASRAGVRGDDTGRIGRLARLLRLGLRGGYRPRTMAGLGARAFAADLVSLTRTPSKPPLDARRAIATRVSEERAAGRTPESIIADLTQDGIPPTYGTRWTHEMIRDLVFEARKGADPEAGSDTGTTP